MQRGRLWLEVRPVCALRVSPGRESLEPLQTTRVSQFLAADCLAVWRLCPQSSTSGARTNYAGNWRLGSCGAVLTSLYFAILNSWRAIQPLRSVNVDYGGGASLCRQSQSLQIQLLGARPTDPQCVDLELIHVSPISLLTNSRETVRCRA